jgi:peptidoglycan/LPS O-acetylase OafA/YrhL
VSRSSRAAVAAEYTVLPTEALLYLDLIRGLAALLVLLGHVRDLFYIDAEQLHRRSVPILIGYLISGMGHQCVIVFFVLSGFFIGHSVLASTWTDRWSWSHYLLRRLSRLYVVLVPGLLLTVVLDRIGMAIFGTDGLYGGHVEGARFLDLPSAMVTSGAKIFLANLCFLQDLRFPTYGTNSSLWSLSYEFWFYIVFPLLVRAVVSTRWRLILVFCALLILALTGWNGVFYFSIWMTGVLVALTWRRLRTGFGRAGLSGGLFVFVCTLCGTRLHAFKSQRLSDAALALVCAVFVAMLLCSATSLRPHRAVRWLGGILASSSYTVYVVHFPMVVLAASALGVRRSEPTVATLPAGLATLLIVWMCSYGVSLLTERRTDDVRRWLERLLARRPTRDERLS